MPDTLSHISDTHFESLRHLVGVHAGIQFPDSRRQVLSSRLAPRLAELGFDDFDQYIAFLTISPRRNIEFQELLSRIAVTNDAFYRYESQFEYFERSVLPRLLESRSSSRRLRIWSAACSTGEEPYTLAILLHRALGIRLADWTIEIHGTDISQQALDIARAARYSASSLRTLPPLLKQKYFRRTGIAWQLNDTTRNLVTFERQNLNCRLSRNRHSQWDVIFCRDVLASFNEATRESTLNHIYGQLADDGTLLLGRGEAICSESSRFSPVPTPGTSCYRKSPPLSA